MYLSIGPILNDLVSYGKTHYNNTHTRNFLSNHTGASKRDIWTRAGGGGRKRLPKFEFSAKFPIGLHVILQIQIKKNRK